MPTSVITPSPTLPFSYRSSFVYEDNFENDETMNDFDNAHPQEYFIPTAEPQSTPETLIDDL